MASDIDIRKYVFKIESDEAFERPQKLTVV